MDERAGVDPRLVATLWERELARYARTHPRCMELREQGRDCMPYGVPMSWMVSYFAHPPVWIDEGHGAHFTCADGIRFLDTNVGDKSTFCGIDPEPVVRAVQQRVANGSQYMLPTEDAIVVARELARRWGLPAWQFTLSASQANTEALRLARHATGRQRILTFTGNYGGHGDEMLTAEAYARAAALGAILADGLEAAVKTAGLPWKVQRLGPRSGISFSDRLARNAAEADADEQPELNALLRLYLANRGVWEAISTAGPAMSVAATQDDVGTYLAAFGEFVTEVAPPA